MTDTVLVGVDHRASARDAVALGAALATALGGELAIVHVHPFLTILGAPPVKTLQDEAEEIVERAAKGCPMPYRALTLEHSSTVGGLHQAAEDQGAQMLVVGSSHRGAMGRIALGSHSERVLTGAPCAVAVAPLGLADNDDWKLKRIAVGYDGSQEAAAAMQTGRRIAVATGGALHLIAVVESTVDGWESYAYRPDWSVKEQRAHERAEQALAAAAAEGETTDVRVGDPIEQLLMLSYGVDLIVLGSRGYGPVRRVLAGATSHRVVREAACPVIVVPRTAEAPLSS